MRTILHFPLFWYVESPRRFILTLPRLVEYLENRFATGLHAKMLFVPLFQDTSLVGRSISLFFRTSRIILGIMAVLFASFFLVLAFVFWLALPLLVIWTLRIYGPPLIILTWTIYYLLMKDRPLRKISGDPAKDRLEEVGTSSLRRVFESTFRPSLLVPALTGFSKVEKLFAKMALDKTKFLGKFQQKIKQADVELDKDKLFKKAVWEAGQLGDSYLDVDHLFLAVIGELKEAEEALFELGVHLEDVKNAALWIAKERKASRKIHLWDEEYELKKLGGVNLAWTARPTPTLDRVSTDLTREAQKGRLPKMIGKKRAIEETIRVLSRVGRDNVIILGKPGCGKTTMVAGLAQRIIEGGVEPALFSKRIVSLDVAALLAGAKTQGELEERLVTIVREIREAGNVILFIDEIHNLVATAGGPGAFNIFAAFEPHLSSSAFQTIGATSWGNYRKWIEPNESFARCFQIVELPEATPQETIKILEEVSYELEKKHKVTISYPALTAAVNLSRSYIHDRVLPDKAVDVLDEAAVLVGKNRPRGVVVAEDVAQIVSAKTQVPVTELTREESAKLLQLEEKLHERIVDQEAAVRAIADALRRARVGLKEEDRPIGALLFIGPTGVGKTEMAKALAETYFGSESAMVRLDMSEYQTKESIAQLLGPPPTAAHAGRGGALTEPVRRRPFTLLLLDEIEKTHPDILNIFLALIDDGRVTDSSGRVVRFNNTIIIATSNAGTYLFDEEQKYGWSREETKAKLKDELTKYFRPEFLNRFDGIIICESLSPQDVLAIVRLKIKKLEEKLAQNDITLVVSKRLISELAKRGFHPTMGARPLRRLIADTLETYLAKRILSQEIKRGDTVKVGLEVFEKNRPDKEGSIGV